MYEKSLQNVNFRVCSCECKIAARKGICLAECRQFYPDSECCGRESTPSTTTVTTSTVTSTTTTATISTVTKVTTITTTDDTTTTTTTITTTATTSTTTKSIFETPETGGDKQSNSSITFPPATEITFFPTFP